MTAKATHAASPVVVELFTSQGCSACPPADSLLTQLRQEFGDSILPLSFHVDYWDNAKWRDPYSSRSSTQRQKTYTAIFRENQVYTPEMVIQGEAYFVGSNSGRAKEEIKKRVSADRSAFELKKVMGSWSGKMDVTVLFPPELSQKAGAITVVVYENAPEVRVEHGENAGVTMSGDFVVRKVFNVAVKKSGDYRIQEPLDARWVKSKTGVAVLVNDNQGIIAAQSIYPLE